jgi:hypothetical protein
MSAASARHPSQFPTIFTLSEADGVLEVADRCRGTVVTFLNAVAEGAWDWEHLAAWLTGPYEALTRVATDIASSKRGSRPPAPPLPPAGDREAVGELLSLTHRETLNVLRAIIDPEQGTTFAFKLVTADLLMRCEDGHGRSGWLPVAKAHLRLAERVHSLIAVDFLTRPEDYEAQLGICGRCSRVEFDALARARGLCRQHAAAHRAGVPRDFEPIDEGAADSSTRLRVVSR